MVKQTVNNRFQTNMEFKSLRLLPQEIWQRQGQNSILAKPVQVICLTKKYVVELPAHWL